MLENINNFRIVVKNFIYLMNLTYILKSLFLKILLIWIKHKWNKIVLIIVF